MTQATDALDAARRGRAALRNLDAQHAAWYAIHAVELDETCALGWALLGHILAEQSGSSLGTWLIHHALSLDIPQVERTEIARYHRIDLWNRGLMAHASGAAMIKGADVDDANAFRPTERLDPFLSGQLAEWQGDAKIARRAALRMVAAMADAWAVPMAEEALSGDVEWAPKVPFTQWRDAGPLSGEAPPLAEAPAAVDPEISILSDYWIGTEVADLVEAEKLEAAEERAKAWSEMRAQKMTPHIALAQVRHSRGDVSGRNEALARLSGLDAEVNELEATRIALAAMDVWPLQVELLDRMDAELPGHPIVLANRGIAKLKTGDVAGAETDLEASLAADSSSIATLANLALVRLQQERYDEAKGMLERAQTADPMNADVLVYLAVCKTNTGDETAAIADLERALRLEPGHAEATRVLAQIRG